MIFYRNTNPDSALQPSAVYKILFVKSAIKRDSGRVVEVRYEDSVRIDGFVGGYVFGESVILSTPNESYVAPLPREYFARWYRRCDIDGNLLDI